MLFKYKIERNQRHSASSTGKIGDPEYRKKKKKTQASGITSYTKQTL